MLIPVNNVGPIQTEKNPAWLNQSGRKLHHHNWQKFGDLPSNMKGLSAKYAHTDSKRHVTMNSSPYD